MREFIIECNAVGHHELIQKLAEMTDEGTEFEGVEFSVEEKNDLDEILLEYGSYSSVFVDEDICNKDGESLADKFAEYLESEECKDNKIYLTTSEQLEERIEYYTELEELENNELDEYYKELKNGMELG